MGATQATASGQVRVFEALGERCGVLLWVPESGQFACRFRRDWADWAGEEAEVLEGIAAQIPSLVEEMGGAAFLAWADENLSNSFRISEPRTALVGHVEHTLNLLYRREVHSRVKPYQTHLPVLGIRAAAGSFGRDMAAHAEGWIEVEVPGRKHLSEDLFIVRIEGHSMEPDIPDGALCVFRSYYGGSRGGGIYLVQRMATVDEGGEVTVKRYASRKRAAADSWRHESIEMQPLNEEYQDWELEQDERYVTIAQFLCVVEDPARG